MADILLLQPSIEDFYETRIRSEPLGLEYLAAACESRGYSVFILDAWSLGGKRVKPPPASVQRAASFFLSGDLSPFRLFGPYSRFGLSDEEIVAEIQTRSPRLIGVSLSLTPYAPLALELVEKVKRALPGIPVVAGGHHASVLPNHVLKSGVVDFVVQGEGEHAFTELVQEILHGGASRPRRGSDSQILSSLPPDVENLPLPARHLTERKRYRLAGKRMGMILASRGCPNQCSFCAVHRVMGRRFRFRVLESILEEMRRCLEEHKIEAFDFEDDNLTADGHRFLDLLNGIVRTFGSGKLLLTAMNGLAYFHMDPSMLPLMKRAGFTHLNLSVGDFSLRGGRPHDPSRLEGIVEGAEREILKTTVYFILGMPGCRLDDIGQIIRFLASLPAFLGPSVFYPVPGTEIFDECAQHPDFDPEAYETFRSSSVPLETSGFSRGDLYTALALCRAINFVKANMGIRRETLREWMHETKKKGRAFAGLQKEVPFPETALPPPPVLGAHLLLHTERTGEWLGLVRRGGGKGGSQILPVATPYQSPELVSQLLDSPVRGRFHKTDCGGRPGA